jgi:predicted RNase H-like HicB family nuclease
MRYVVVIEKGEISYGAYVPDLPGCVAVAESLAEVRSLIKEAIRATHTLRDRISSRRFTRGWFSYSRTCVYL